MTNDLSRLLRLEVERDPDEGERINLVPNPTGELGAWGWVTPVANSTMVATRVSGAFRLMYASPGSVPSYFYTEPMPVAAGQYAAARWQAPTVVGTYTAKIEWLNASLTVISSTTASPAYAGSTSARIYGTYLAPAGTVYARLRFDHFDGSGGNPGFLTSVQLREVVFTVAATGSDLASTRVNLLRTPTGDGGTGDWGSGGGTVGLSTSVQLNGRDSLTLTKDGETGPVALVSGSMGVFPGRDYAFQARSRAQTHARDFSVAVRWFNSAGNEISTVELGTATSTSGVWTGVVGGVATAPTSAVSMRLRAQYKKMDPAEVHYVNAAMVEQATSVGAWFDGDTTDAGGVTYAWTGTPYASTSTAATAPGDPGVLVPVPYQNILGPTNKITADREGFNVGSLSVRLFDAVLDPTQSDLIQTGRRIRLVTVGDTGPDQVLFAGKILTGAVTYHLLEKDEQKRAEVNLTAVDPISALANAPRKEGVATIAELPYVLEGAGTPWSCNGNGNQVFTATVTSYNDNASALDQVAVTRDSVLGYAWLDRNGVLQAWDSDKMDTTVAAVLDESTYNADFDVSIDLDRIINSVTVRVLRTIATTGASEEVAFGPYVDTDSYRQYGEHAQEYVVQGFDVTDAAGIQAYAQQILDANAQPRLRVNSMVVPIREAADLQLATLDLYDLVTVQNGRASLDEDARVTTVTHDISAAPSGFKWLMRLGFSAEGSVAPSTAVPAPPPSVGAVKDELAGGYDGSLQDIYDLADSKATEAYVNATAATISQTAANGRSKVTYSTSVPGTTANVAGDIWFRKDAATQTIIGQWQGLGGTSWQQVMLNDQVIANLDAGKLVAGSAFTNALWVKTNLTLGDATTDGVIQSYNFAGSTVGVYLSKGSVVVKGGTLSAAAVTGSTFSTAGSFPITIAGAGIGWSTGAAISETGTNLTIQRGSSAITLSSSGIDMFGSVDASGSFSGSFSGSHSGSHSGSWSGGLTASGAVHGSTIFADSVPTTGAAINAVMGGSGQFLMYTSSQRYKYDIETAALDPAAVLALRPTTHRRFDDPEYDEDNPEAGPLYLSPIAEEVAEVSEWMVTRDDDGEPNGLNWQAITLHLIETVKDLASQIEELRAP